MADKTGQDKNWHTRQDKTSIGIQDRTRQDKGRKRERMGKLAEKKEEEKRRTENRRQKRREKREHRRTIDVPNMAPKA